MSTPAQPSSLISDLRALPRSFWVLFAGTFINRFGTFVWPFLTIYLTRQGHTLAEAAWAISGFGGGAIFGSAAGGWLADHIGRRNTIVLGTFTTAAGVMLLYTATSLPAIIVCTALVGSTNGTYHPAASALIVDVVPNALRVRAYSAFRLAANAGFACGASVGGLLATHSLFWLFAGDSLTTAFYGLIAIFWLPHGLRGQTKNAPWGDAFVSLKRNHAFQGLWVAAFCSAMVFSQFGSTYSLHILRLGLTLDVLGFHLAPETVYGLLIAWNGVLVVFAELPLTSLTLRFDARRVMAAGYVLIGLGFGLNAWCGSVPTLLVAMTIFTIGEMISSPTASASVARLAPERLRGRYMGMLALAWNGAGVLGPQFGFRSFGLDPRFVWFGCALLGLMAAATTLRFGRSGALLENEPAREPEPEPAGVP
ncbi:major facilitator superfamily MFS_1 [Chthoniobacter flavus Ellin428]|uniref:Major facilitator superfamily MFS_1 n=1 Tax=Chthoniobacter flavus Ellin428 TaxID=497964 RepID=B4D0G3_9BACT|nr:MFS transporter [Chthoniobacter flavus]EDY19825.1 major facilitator superfamily MFS_1 [Chthoniobacter flavus Ellin428]TCO91901.1 dipeptide/tripeptide permease [Chthoniobacter flavus]